MEYTMNNYDGIVFGNGMTIHLLQQIIENAKPKKKYLFSFNSYMKMFCDDSLSPRENNNILKVLYQNHNKEMEKVKGYSLLRNEVCKYFRYCDGNIEYHLGYYLFDQENSNFDYSLMKSILPLFYNIWYITLKDYLKYINADQYIEYFYRKLEKLVNNRDYIWTTNFDGFADNILHTKHIHGTFQDEIKRYEDIVLYHDAYGKQYYKFVWAHNGLSKADFLMEYKCIESNSTYFHTSFLWDEKLSLDHILVYGISFQISGWAKRMEDYKEIYKEPQVGAFVDDHIILRLSALQNSKRLNKITICYYNDEEKSYFEKILKLYDLKAVTLLKSDNIDLTIAEI